MGKTATKRNRKPGTKPNDVRPACYAIDGATRTLCGNPLYGITNRSIFPAQVSCKRCVKALKRRERGL